MASDSSTTGPIVFAGLLGAIAIWGVLYLFIKRRKGNHEQKKQKQWPQRHDAQVQTSYPVRSRIRQTRRAPRPRQVRHPDAVTQVDVAIPMMEEHIPHQLSEIEEQSTAALSQSENTEANSRSSPEGSVAFSTNRPGQSYPSYPVEWRRESRDSYRRAMEEHTSPPPSPVPVPPTLRRNHKLVKQEGTHNVTMRRRDPSGERSGRGGTGEETTRQGLQRHMPGNRDSAPIASYDERRPRTISIGGERE